MKLTIVKLGLLSAQDKVDLSKIWPYQQPADWSIDEDRQMIFAARFNDRLLGAVKVTVEAERAELKDLCVREVTRRRGVGLYLLEDLQNQLPAVKIFALQTLPDNALPEAFMLACGFELTANGWVNTR